MKKGLFLICLLGLILSGAAVCADTDPDLLFSALSSAIVPGPPATWSTDQPVGVALTPVYGTPGTATLNGQQWEMNHWLSGDRFITTPLATGAVPMNGGSIVVACRPVRLLPGVDNHNWDWDSIVDLQYSELVLGIRNWDGLVNVRVKGSLNVAPAATAIPSGQITVLSLVVQPDGTFAVYSNGTQIMTGTGGGAMTELNNAGLNGSAIGCNAYDGWPAFNGNIGDVYVYKVALDDAKRTALENTLIAKYGSASTYTITATAGAGGAINPVGAVPVPQDSDAAFTITPNKYFDITGLTVDGSASSITNKNGMAYTFAAVNANHTIDAQFTEWVPTYITGKVTKTGGGLEGALITVTGGREVYTGTTDSAGNYSIRIEPGLNYVITAFKRGYSMAPASLTATPPSDYANKNFVATYVGTQKLIDLKVDAAWTDGQSITSWPNLGILGGNFVVDGGKMTAAATVAGDFAGRKAVTFAFSKLMLSTDATTADASLIRAPMSITGNGAYTVVAQLCCLYPLPGEQYYFAFAKNGGDGTCAAFNYGTVPAWGAVAHWGWRDMGWTNPETNAGPSINQWHHVAIAFDGMVEKVYLDGYEVNTENKTLAIYANNPFVLGSRFDGDNAINMSSPFEGALSQLTVYDNALSAYDIATLAGVAPPPTYLWKGPNNGLWNNADNWNNNIPGLGYGDQTAVFSDSAAAGATVDLDNDTVELGGITFNNLVPNTTIMSSTGQQLGLYKNATSCVDILTQGGAHTISTNLFAPSGIAKMGPGTLTLSGNATGIGSMRADNNVVMDIYGADSKLIIVGNIALYATRDTHVCNNASMEITGTYATSGHDQIIGSADHGGGTATVTISGSGSWTHTGAGAFQIGNDGLTNIATMNIKDNGVLDLNSLGIGIGWAGGSIGIINQDGGRVTNHATGGTRFGWNIDANAKATYNFNAGVHEAFRIRGDLKGTNIFNLNGGTIRALGVATNTSGVPYALLYNLTHAYVKAGGVKFDSNGFEPFTTQALEHDPALGTTPDGGVTKLGAGKLTMQVDSTYTGPTNVQAGTLAVSTVDGLGAGGALNITSGAVVALNYTGIHQVAKLTFDGVEQAFGTWGATGSGAYYLDDIHFSGTGVVNVPNTSTPVAKISDLKGIADGTVVQISGKNVTAITSGGIPAGVFYIEETDRSAGLKINWAGPMMINDSATITGVFHKPATGEMYIDASAVTAAEGAATKPVFVTTATLSGKLLDGMLVRVAGKVGTVGANYYIVNDGGVDTKVMTGVAPSVNTGFFVSLTGIGSYDGTVRAVLQPE